MATGVPKGALPRVARYLRPYRGSVVGALALVALSAALEIARPWPLKIVVDFVLGDRPSGLGASLGLGKEAILVGACAGLLGLQVAIALIAIYLNRTTIGIGQRMVNDLRSELVAHLHGLSLGFFGRRPASDLVYRVAFDTYAVQSIAMNGLFPLVTAAMLLGGMTAVMIYMNPILAAIFLGIAPVLFLTIRLLGRRISRLATETREDESRFFSETRQGVGDIHIVQAFTAEPREQARIKESSSRALSSARRLYVFETRYSGVVSVLVALGTAAVLYVGGVLGLAGRLSGGDLVVFVAYLASLYAPINSISQTVGLVQQGLAGVRRVFSVLDTEPEVCDAPGAAPAGELRGEVRFENVSFAYPDSTPTRDGGDSFALRDVAFEISPGTFVAVVGPTGAGKTTLLSLLPRFYDPTGGRILLDGADIRGLRVRSLRAQIGIVPQAPVIFPATLAENIRYGRPQASEEELLRAADLAGVSGFAERLPRGFATAIGPEGQALSHGQMQRVTIARALLTDPRILILDEPTSALDSETETYVMSGIEHAVKSRTTFVIAHRLSTVQRADRVLVLDEGRLVESGTYDSLSRGGGRFQRLLEAQLLPLQELRGRGEVA